MTARGWVHYSAGMVRFKVSDVAREERRLPTVGAVERVAELGWRQPEAYRLGAAELVDGPLVNPLALAVDLAFREHRPLVLTPDAVWLCLAQSLALHVDLHAEALRPRLVRHAGQLELEVRRDDFILGHPDNDWPAALETMTALIRAHLGGRADLFVADFSTTGPLERTASQIALMGAMRQYFRYVVDTRCGIPEITLAGTAEDWTSIRRRAAVFGEFELGWWLEVLDPVLAKLEDTARGTIDLEFWRRIYKSESESGGDRSYGWLNALFAYVGDPPERNTFPGFDAPAFRGNQLSDYPSGRTRVPFTWKYLDLVLEMELIGGLWGVTQDERGALGTVAGWLVSPARGLATSARIRDGSSDRTLTLASGESFASLGREVGDRPVALALGEATNLASIAGIEHLPGLVAITISGGPLLETAALLEGIEHLPGLVALSISGAPLLESIAPLAGMPRLRHLHLEACGRMADLRRVLQHLPELETLYLVAHPQLQDHDFFPITKLGKLRHLSLVGCRALPEPLRREHHGPEAVALAREDIAALR